MLFRLALLEGGAEERLSASFGCRQPAAASLSAAGPVPESGASSQKRQAAGRQNAAFSQILGAGAFEAAGKPCPTGCGTALPSGQPKRAAPRDSRKCAQIGQNSFQGRSFPFLSTLPVRGATCYSWRSRYRRWYFYPRSPQGERQRTFPSLPISPLFLSTLPAKGSDPSATGAAPGWPYFYPHSPQGERHGKRSEFASSLFISIHTPRKGNDDKIQQTSKMDFAQKSQIKISNTQNRMQFCVSSTILT